MAGKRPKVSRGTGIPVDYIVSDPGGNRASRRMHAKEKKAAERGRTTGHGTGAAPASLPQQPIEETGS